LLLSLLPSIPPFPSPSPQHPVPPRPRILFRPPLHARPHRPHERGARPLILGHVAVCALCGGDVVAAGLPLPHRPLLRLPPRVHEGCRLVHKGDQRERRLRTLRPRAGKGTADDRAVRRSALLLLLAAANRLPRCVLSFPSLLLSSPLLSRPLVRSPTVFQSHFATSLSSSSFSRTMRRRSSAGHLYSRFFLSPFPHLPSFLHSLRFTLSLPSSPHIVFASAPLSVS
jgi:hypothetical protein